MEKHFTVTGFVVHDDKTLLLWHPLLKMWVPPGGHIETDEDPLQALLREIREETGIDAAPLPGDRRLDVAYPRQLPAPYTILVENSPEPDRPHHHIDLIYFCRPSAEPPALRRDGTHLTWVDEAQLAGNDDIPLGSSGATAPVPEDVRLLALTAIAKSRQSGG